MLEATAARLRCPGCHADGSLALAAAPTPSDTDPAAAGGTGRVSPASEVRVGELTCDRCGLRAPVRDGIADLLHEPSQTVVREAAGLARFADVMRADGWDRERILTLPDEDSPFWYGQRTSFQALQRAVAFRPGERLLDVGSNTCWASAAFAREGLEVTALDIATHQMQGLATADWWMQRDGTHFERVLGVMYDLPLASGSLDHVFCCEVLHHNHARTLLRTLREAHRVLAPGGRLSVIRETLRAPRTPQLRPGHEVAEFEGNEHAFLAATYLLAARAAGFDVQVLDPAGQWVLSDEPFRYEGKRRRARLKLGVLDAARRRPRSRRAYRAWLHHVDGRVPLHFVATKR